MLRIWLIKLVLGTVLAPSLFADEVVLQQARELMLRGRYAEARETARSLEAELPVEAAILSAEALASTGNYDQARKTLLPRFEQESNRRDIALAMALLYDRRWPNGDGIIAIDRLLKLDPDDLVGRWLKAKLLLHRRKYEEGQKALAWFAENSESHKPVSSEDALALASALAEHARWSRESKWYNTAVNDVLGKAEKDFPRDWRIPALRAEMFAEKHNEPAAVDSLNAALAKNGVAAELHALRARFAIDEFDLVAARRSLEQARRANPNLPEGYLLEADIAFAELRAGDAERLLTSGRGEGRLNDNPEVLGRLAAAREAQRKPAPLEIERNRGLPSAPELMVQGDALDRMRRFSQAKEAYDAALRARSDYPGVRGRLAQQLLRLGEEEEGAKLLADAAKEDPFDVRLKNTLAVLDVLAIYATLETEHFRIRFDRGRDELLATYVAEYLESDIYPDLVRRFGYEPHGKSLIEIYNRSGSTSGHGWFSARMVGVPGLHTIGACAGQVVAIASPTDMPRPYNWARVLRHEFVHLLNLQQTEFNVPHWATEGLAVSAEDRRRPDDWMRLLTQRAKDEELFALDDINFGFIRPSNSRDWTCAYAQAELYIEFLAGEYGDESVSKMLAAFADNRTTPQAIEAATGVAVEEFEQRYRHYVDQLIEQWGLRDSVASQDIDRLKQQISAEPGNARLQAALAAAHLAQGELPLARKHAADAARLVPREPTAAFVLASLAVSSKDRASAERIAQSALDPGSPHEGLLSLLADIKLAAKEYAVAEKLLLLGKKRFPALAHWNKSLAKLYALRDDDARLEPLLVELTATEEDDASIPEKLAELAAARGDTAEVEKWSRATLQINVQHGPSHARLAEILTAREKLPEAVREWRAAVAADVKQAPWKLALARLLIRTGEREQAKALLEDLVESAPGLPGLVEATQELRP